MKKVFTAIAISMSAFMATTAMAGPNDHRDDRYPGRDCHAHDCHDDHHDRGRRDAVAAYAHASGYLAIRNALSTSYGRASVRHPNSVRYYPDRQSVASPPG